MSAVFPGRVTYESVPQLLVVLARDVKRGDAILLDSYHFEVFMDAELIPPPEGVDAPASAIITYESSFEGETCAGWVAYPENERVLVRRPLPVEE